MAKLLFRSTFSPLKGKSWLLNHVIYLRNLDKLSVLNDKIDQNTNFVKLPSAKWLSWYNCKF